jgi:hypothetical protein
MDHSDDQTVNMQKTNRVSLIGKSLFLAWLMLCIGIFIYFPSRISYLYWANFEEWQYFPERLARLDWAKYLLQFLGSLGGITIFSIACISLGKFIAQIFKINDKSSPHTALSKLAILSTDFILGSGTFSIIFLVVAGLGSLTPFGTALVLLAGFLLGFQDFIRAIPTMFEKNTMIPLAPETNGKVILWMSLTILALNILQTTARMSYDGSAIYFSDAKLTALSNHVEYFTDDTFVASAFQPAIQYTVLIQLFGDQTARMHSWLCGVVIILISMALGERVGLSKQARIILLAFLLTSTAFIDLMGDGKVDLISAAPAIASIYWAVTSDKPTPRPRLLLLGFLVGYACVARPFNVFVLGIFLVIFYFQQTFLARTSESKKGQLFLLTLIWISLGAIGWGIYYLFTNWIITGNPLAFLSSISAINPASGPWDADPNQILFFRIFYPLVVSFRNTPQSLGNITPLFIGFLPAIFSQVIRRRTRISNKLLGMTIASIITLLLWIYLFFTVVEIRYVFFLWIILFIPMAELTATTIETKTVVFQRLGYFIIAILLGFVCLRTIYISIDSYSPLDKQGNPQCFDLPLCESFKPINRIASAGARVLTLSAYRYYLRTDLLACSTTHEEYNRFQNLSMNNPDAFWMEIYRRGYKYIVADNDYAIRHLRFELIPSPLNAPPWINLSPMYKYSMGGIVAYEIDVTAPPIRIEFQCTKQAGSGVWEIEKIP